MINKITHVWEAEERKKYGPTIRTAVDNKCVVILNYRIHLIQLIRGFCGALSTDCVAAYCYYIQSASICWCFLFFYSPIQLVQAIMIAPQMKCVNRKIDSWLWVYFVKKKATKWIKERKNRQIKWNKFKKKQQPQQQQQRWEVKKKSKSFS